MKQAYPFLPDNEPDKESLELKRRTKVAAAAVLTSLELGDTVYSAVTGGLHDLKLVVTLALWLVLAVVWYWILRDRGKR